MPTVADQLRTAREAALLSPQQVAEITKLKTDQIECLERADYSSFPAPIYIRGSVRTYAKLLKLDVPKVMAQLDAEFANTKELSDPPPLTPRASGVVDWLMLQFSKLDWRIIAGLGTLLLVLIIVWSFVRPVSNAKRADPLSNLGPGLYSPRQTSRGDLLPLPTNAPPR